MLSGRRGLITGAHRSGTTWIGRALSLSHEVAVLHEPFNYHNGLEGIPRWYPTIINDQEKHSIAKIFQAIFEGKARYLRNRHNDPAWKALIRNVIGGPDDWRYKKMVKGNFKHIVLKDPFCVLLSGWMVTELDFRIVVMVKHPGAYLNSIKRMSWGIPTVSLGQFKMIPYDESAPGNNNGSEFAREVGVFWHDIYAEVIKQIE